MSRFKFSVGPWNVSEGADAFGPEVRKTIPFGKKVETFKQLGFDAVQFHDDDAVPEMNELTPEQIRARARETRHILDQTGMAAEFVAPR